jgi:hypothetical protein
VNIVDAEIGEPGAQAERNEEARTVTRGETTHRRHVEVIVVIVRDQHDVHGRSRSKSSRAASCGAVPRTTGAGPV